MATHYTLCGFDRGVFLKCYAGVYEAGRCVLLYGFLPDWLYAERRLAKNEGILCSILVCYDSRLLAYKPAVCAANLLFAILI